ncbi:MAG: DUF262 domain-containing protein, partial [Beijerinckiaceae bacterium]
YPLWRTPHEFRHDRTVLWEGRRRQLQDDTRLWMSATNFNTRNDTFRKLLGNGLTYRVPRFQRDYSWEEEHWDDLWQDILGTVNEGGEVAHYMGYLVLQTPDDKVFDIIDGQQRLTTLSLIVLAALKQLKRLKSEGNDPDRAQQRLDGLRQTYIGYLDPVSLVTRSKLTLNRNNDNYYQTYLVALADTLPQRRFKASERLLRKAFEWFDRQLRDYIIRQDDPGQAIARLIDTMSDRLFFTVITVTDELNAYKVFETLNARGVRLSATDLLKNYLFSVLHRGEQRDHELRNLDERWESIVGRLGAESFPDFLRAHWISRHSFVRQADLFKTISGKVPSRESVFHLLAGLEEDMDPYLALSDPEPSTWPLEQKENVRLLRMFSVRQPVPLLLAAKRRFVEAEFGKLLKAIVNISFRYNVIGNQQTSEQERRYHAVAQQIASGQHDRIASVIAELAVIYPKDDAFRSAFTEKTITTTQSRNTKIVRYILSELNREISGSAVDFDSPAVSLEHICPQNPEDGWEEFSDEDVETLVMRLGNMTLLEQGANMNHGNIAYQEKRKAYAASGYEITRRVAAENDNWTPQRLAIRQKAMAKLATSIWKVSQLS